MTVPEDRSAAEQAAEREMARLIAAPLEADLHEVLRRVRELDPVHWSDSLRAWFVTSWEAVLSVTKDPVWSSVPSNVTGFRGGASRPRCMQLMDMMMSRLDGAEHAKFRKLSNRIFSGRAAEARRPMVRKLAAELVGRALSGERSFDMVADLAFDFPLYVTCHVLGIPVEDMGLIHRWSDAYVGVLQPHPTREALEAGDRMFEELGVYLDGLLAKRRAEGDAPSGDDFLTDLVAGESRGELNRDEVVSSFWNIIFASHETTTNLLSNGLLLLLEHRDQLDLLLARPELMPAAVEEIMRFSSGSTMILPRSALHDTDLGGKRIRKGDRVFAAVAAANRDPSVFEDPDRFDIERPKVPHVGFGRFSHVCLGASLARVEAQELYLELFSRAPELVREGTLVRKNSWMMTGPASCPVRF